MRPFRCDGVRGRGRREWPQRQVPVRGPTSLSCRPREGAALRYALVTSTVTAPRRQLWIPIRSAAARPSPTAATISRPWDRPYDEAFTFIAPVGLDKSPLTCIHVRLLGPCFKTGRMEHRLFAHRERPSSDSCKAPKELTVGGTRRGHRRIPRVDTRRKLAGRQPKLGWPTKRASGSYGTVTLSGHSPGL